MLPLALQYRVMRSALSGFVSQNAVDWAYTGSGFPITDTLFYQPIADFPSEDCGVLLLVLYNFRNNRRRRDLRFASSDGTGTNGAGLVVPSKDFTDAAMRDEKSAGDFARAHAAGGELHDAMANVVRQGPTVHEGSSELVESTMSLKQKGGNWKKESREQFRDQCTPKAPINPYLPPPSSPYKGIEPCPQTKQTINQSINQSINQTERQTDNKKPILYISGEELKEHCAWECSGKGIRPRQKQQTTNKQTKNKQTNKKQINKQTNKQTRVHTHTHTHTHTQNTRQFGYIFWNSNWDKREQANKHIFVGDRKMNLMRKN